MAPFDARTITGLFAGRYSVERELGRGGTAVVYLARDQRHGTPVAIKVLRQEISQTIGAERFLREIRVSEGLHHPHILQVLDSGDHAGVLYFALPLADGGTLRQRLGDRRQLPLQEVIDIAGTVAAALDHAHAKGLVHRDVKPENILFSNGIACLADFGIARALEHSASESTTSSGIVRGTPAYMSPEQASGEAVLDGRSDLYSLACVVYEMLSGMMPFDGPTPQSIIAMRFTHPARPVRQFRASLPVAIDGVMARALAVAPADRYQTGAEFIDALETASRSSDPILTPPSVPARRVQRWWIGALVVGLGTVATVVLRLPRSQPGGIPEGDPRRVAVMYFEDRTPTALPQHVVDGITEDLIDQLGETQSLQVVSTFGARSFRGSAASVDSIRRALKVGTIITGSVASVGDSVRLNVRLIEAATGQQVAIVPMATASSDVLGLRRELAERIAFSLRQLIGERIAVQETRSSTKSEEAWETAKLAASLLRRASAESAIPFIEADSAYAKAARLDPGWSLPWVGRGRIAIGLAQNRAHSPDSLNDPIYQAMSPAQRHLIWYRLALVYVDSALKRDPRSASALAMRGETRYLMSIYSPATGDSLRRYSERDLRAALAIRPDLAIAWTNLASDLQAQRRFVEAAEAAQRAYEADPFFDSRRTLATAFFAALFAGQFSTAHRWCVTALEHYRQDPRFTECELTLLGWTGHTAADVANARRLVAEIERADTLSQLADTWGYRRIMVAAAAARAGLREIAHATLADIHSGKVPEYARADIEVGESYVMLLAGNRDSSLGILGRVVSTTPEVRATVATHPWFEPLRGDPRFVAITQVR